MVKTFDPPHCHGEAFTVQSKGIPASGTLGLVETLTGSLLSEEEALE
jgi:hypothetical protein